MARKCETENSEEHLSEKLPIFERYLSLWVALCIILGILLGRLLPELIEPLSGMEIARVNIPVAILIWLMIYPMMVQIDFSSLKKIVYSPKGLFLTLFINWLVKPFTMAFIATLFLRYIFQFFIEPETATEYIAGAILLGAAPCTAMVFVWSYLTKGDPVYTLVQVAVNNLVLLIAFVPIVRFLLGISDIIVPYDTLFLSVVLYIVIPLTAGYLSRIYLLKTKGPVWFENNFLRFLKPLTIGGLLLTLIILFSFQGDRILQNPVHILLIAIPLTIQTFLIFTIAYLLARKLRIKHNVGSPAAMIGASNFFELAVAVAISLFGLTSGAALATVVGVLVEVPVMLSLVYIANKTRHWFDKESSVQESPS